MVDVSESVAYDPVSKDDSSSILSLGYVYEAVAVKEDLSDVGTLSYWCDRELPKELNCSGQE